MTVCNFIILVCLWIAIGFIYWFLHKIFSIVSDFKLDLRQNHSFTHETKYVPFFELFDKKSFREMLQDCIQGKDDIEIDLQDIISEQKPKNAVESILENYNVTPKEKQE